MGVFSVCVQKRSTSFAVTLTLLAVVSILLAVPPECRSSNHGFYSDFQSESVETGLKFLEQAGTQKLLGFDDNIFKVDEGDKFYGQKARTFVKRARMLIRSVKGLLSETDSDELGTNQEDSEDDKPAWCFYPYLLRTLATIEHKMYNIIVEFYKNNKEHRKSLVLESYLKDFEESTLQAINLQSTFLPTISNEATEDVYLYVATHPLLVYRMIRRFADDWPAILSESETIDEHGLWVELLKVNTEKLVFPDWKDVEDALQSIQRIQKGTDLKTVDLAKGKIEDVETHIRLNAFHQLEVGLHMLELEAKDFDFAIEWVNLALETVLISPITNEHPEIERFFRMALDHVVARHNHVWMGFKINKFQANVFNATVTLPFEPRLYKRMHHELHKAAAEKRRTAAWNWAVDKNFIQLCSGTNLQSEKEKARLKCWNDFSRHPYWLINPLKVELLSDDPPVFQMYDFIGNKMIDRMINEAKRGLMRSRVVDKKDPDAMITDKARTSSQIWVHDTLPEGEYMVSLRRRMEFMSSLTFSSLAASDSYQVACYGVSHHYGVHMDSFEDERRNVEKGNRITTIMGYLNDVIAGGKTGFPIAGVAANPVKGSIVMWDSLMRNGEDRDMRGYHGGCPVALGIKWITNKWVYYKENFQHFKCDLDPYK